MGICCFDCSLLYLLKSGLWLSSESLISLDWPATSHVPAVPRLLLLSPILEGAAIPAWVCELQPSCLGDKNLSTEWYPYPSLTFKT